MKHYKNPETNEIYAYEQDGSQDALIPENFIPITNEEANKLRAQLMRADFIKLNYAEKRRSEYPSIGDQLDALWKGGADAEAMRAQVMAVKDKYPK